MNKRIAIFGAGLSGQSARRLASAQAYEVTVFDEGGEGDRASLDASAIDQFDHFVFSPGFAAAHPWRVLAEASGKPVQSELSFAAGYWKGQIIGVTGTNGKSTLTRFLAGALERAGQKAVVAGNIGHPLSDVVLDFENSETSYAVCEISSFQAELADGLELDALLWTNFAEDHLDRYENMTEYFMAKARLIECLKNDAVCVIGPQVVHWFDLLHKPFGRAVVAFEDTALTSQLKPDCVLRRLPYSEDFSLAAEYWWLTGKDEASLLAAADEFTLAPYRLDVVREKGGITYWNDSKSTNFHSALAALNAVPKPIVWIGGGRIKGGDLEAFAKEVSSQIHAAVLYGEVAQRMEQALTTEVEIVQTYPCFEQAVRAACELAATSAPCHVLLSPGFSSFDQFESYEARGKSFNSLVLGL
ncbi:UDP-N-acetylmuramoyl-L-alanine--D-glutamate ligase [Coraliomargarita sinensis]|uniref:UDP-N-acetylmuramoylalanine--D-glutamate ligase n=1 Tax=Coraliomargarita sinensis TaxID=2174842 RepID=A0A317ZPF2_9BACT|nr:UDP-N-acetylmuramoyl-L-alanine--D-glutamate ligase [Coraliomargarita sinensis]PXA05251.1 UDP-N-acetylmuramoyl-L-alanine--D-glutamate ligase [Coraliomargarita sinensis]